MAIAAAPLLWIFSEVVPAAPPDTSKPWIIIVSAVGASLLTLLGQLLLRRQTKDKLIAEASNEVAEGAKALLEEYRMMLDKAHQEAVELRERVDTLEAKLKESTKQRQQLIEEHEQTLHQLEIVQARMKRLESEIALLGGEVEDDAPATPPRRRARKPPAEPG